MCIEEYIPYGKDNAISREQLCGVARLSDRQMRQEIEDARKRCPIINLQDGKGYYRPTAEEKSDVEAWLRIQKSWMNKIREAMLGARNYIQDVSGQLSLFD